MKRKPFFSLILFFISRTVLCQVSPEINITFSKLYSTYHFVKHLSENYPDNKYKQIFINSEFNTPHYYELIHQMDTLNIHEAYSFQGYPSGQKIPVMTISLIERNLINASSLQEFKKITFGIIPSSELSPFCNILNEFEFVYDKLIYNSNKIEFDKKLEELRGYVQQSNLVRYFEQGLTFYNSEWDYSVPITIAVIPSIKENGFRASAFLNNAVCEVPLKFKNNDILFSVLMHEIYHSIYNEQSLQFKLKMESWFNDNSSLNSQYAFLLLNEALATALGNGNVYEQLNGKTDHADWYNVKYINLMAKKIYPIVKSYLTDKKSIDKNFVDRYIAIYDQHFSEWINELDNLFAYRYVITDKPYDVNYFRMNYPYASMDQSEYPITQNGLQQMKQTPISKIIIVSTNHKDKLTLIQNTFPELHNWKYNPEQEFIHSKLLNDKTAIIIINQINSKIDELFKAKFNDRWINFE